MNAKKIIVISAVNLVEAGTLAILKDCLSYLSSFVAGSDYRVIAIVHSRSLAEFPNIEYVETTWPKKRWVNRLWYEYISMKRISKELSPVHLWFSLHDTSPSVIAQRRAVYCHNAFSFYKWGVRDLLFAPKIALFALLTKYIYKPNIRKNNFVVVQQAWFRNAISNSFRLEPGRIIVAPPETTGGASKTGKDQALFSTYTFLYPASPNSHKNFEVICRAVELLKRKGIADFRVILTSAGTENKYAKWLYSKWGHLKEITFSGFLSKEVLKEKYQRSHCLLFPSKVETWGLPISEFSSYNRPMLLADLPYSHETAAGARQVAYFDPDDPQALARMMAQLIAGNSEFLAPEEKRNIQAPVAGGWAEIFTLLLK